MQKRDDDGEDLYERLEREALFREPDEEDEAELDIVDVVSGKEGEQKGPAADLTLAGYWKLHTRPPAFEGVDGQPYTVDVETEATKDPERPFVAFFVFIRWAATGAGIMEHAETDDVASGKTEEEARAAALDFTLYEVKAELDAAIERKRRLLEE
jgi:hypothetical protein